MKIAYVHSGTWPSSSPSVTFAGMTATGIAEAGGEAVLFVKRGSTEQVEKVYEKLYGRTMPPSLKILALGGGLLSVLRTHQVHHWAVRRILWPMLRSGQLDGVVSRSCTFLPSLVALHRAFNVPAWYESHDFYADLRVRTDINASRFARYERLERTCLPRISGLICLQNAQAQLYRTALPGLRIEVARTGLDTPVQRREGAVRRNCIAYVGSLDAYKGVNDLLDAVGKCRDDVQLVIVGARGDAETLRVRQRADALGMAARVCVHPWLDKTKLGEILATVCAGVAPLRDTFFNRNVTSPLKILDYYRFGLPVIAPDLPTVRELVDDGQSGLVYAPSDTSGLAGCIDRITSLGASEYGRMEQLVRARAQSLTWQRRGRELIALCGAKETGGPQ